MGIVITIFASIIITIIIIIHDYHRLWSDGRIGVQWTRIISTAPSNRTPNQNSHGRGRSQTQQLGGGAKGNPHHMEKGGGSLAVPYMYTCNTQYVQCA